jgi:hypothetical protein
MTLDPVAGRALGAQGVMATAYRRRIFPEVGALMALLADCRQEDRVENLLKETCVNFRQELANEYPEEWEARFFAALKRVLIDDLSALSIPDFDGLPLDDPFLGSDGYIYERRTLAAHFNEAAPEHQECSPLTGEGNFYVEPHRGAKICLDWLRSKGALSGDADPARAYDHLREIEYPVTLPFRENQEARREELEDFFAYREANQEERRHIGDFERGVERLQTEHLVRIEEEMAAIRAHTVEMGEETDQQLRMIGEGRLIRAAQVVTELTTLNDRVASSEIMNAELTVQLSHLSARISQADKELLYLNKAIQETALAIEKAKKAKKKRLLTAILMGTAQVSITMMTGGSVLTLFIHELAKEAGDRVLTAMGVSEEGKIMIRATAGGAFSGTDLVKGSVRGATIGATIGAATIVNSKFGPPFAPARDAVQGVINAVGFSGVPKGKDVVVSVATEAMGGVISRDTGQPVSISVEDGKVNLGFKPGTI